MKKKLSIILALALAVTSLAACGQQPAATQAPATEAAATEAPTTKADVTQAATVVAQAQTAAPSVAPTTAAPTEAPEEAKKDAVIVVGFDSEPSSLNAMLTGATLSYWTTDMCHSTLVTWNENNSELIPCVAETWEYESDTRLIFKLRKDVKMHNGEQVTADTIKFTMEWNLDEANASKLRSTFAPYVDNIEVVDDYTVAFNLKQPFAPLLKSLWHVPIISASTVDTLETAPIGCGPFIFDGWEKNQYIKYKANPDYFAGAPAYSELELRFFGSAATLLTAYLAGEVDMIYWMNANDKDTVLGTGDSYIYEAIASSRYLMLNQENEILQNEKVRKAIQLAIDKNAIIKYVGNGYGQTCSVALTQDNPFYPVGMDYERNLEEAKKLLAEAGYPDGFKIELIAPNTTGEGGAATVLQESLRELGLDVELNLLEVAAYLSRAAAHEFELAVCGSTLAADPHLGMKAWMDNETQHSNCSWNNEEFTKLMEEASTISDDAKRNELYQQAWKIFIDDAVIDYLFIEDKLAALRDNLQGFQYHLGYHDFTHMYVTD